MFHAVPLSAAPLLPCIPECWLKHFLVPLHPTPLHGGGFWQGADHFMVSLLGQGHEVATPLSDLLEINPVGKKVEFLPSVENCLESPAVADEHPCPDLNSYSNFFLLRSEYKNQLRWL